MLVQTSVQRFYPFDNQVFVDEFFRETQLPGISHLPTAPVRAS